MNKIILDKKSIIDLKINEDSIIEIDNKIDLTLNILIEDNNKLEIKCNNGYIEGKLNINIKQNNNTDFLFISRNNVDKELNININIDLLGNNSNNILDIHEISNSGKVFININGTVKKNTLNNILEEKIHIITLNNGIAKVLPNMLISSKEVIANHGVTISKISNKYLEYLMSKGIEKKDCIDLIIKGFLK